MSFDSGSRQWAGIEGDIHDVPHKAVALRRRTDNRRGDRVGQRGDCAEAAKLTIHVQARNTAVVSADDMSPAAHHNGSAHKHTPRRSSTQPKLPTVALRCKKRIAHARATAATRAHHSADLAAASCDAGPHLDAEQRAVGKRAQRKSDIARSVEAGCLHAWVAWKSGIH